MVCLQFYINMYCFEHMTKVLIYSKPKVTLHYSFLNISSVILNCNKVSIEVCLLHVSKHNACKAVDVT